MDRLRRLFGLPVSDWERLGFSLAVVSLVRLSLWLLPFRAFRALASRLSGSGSCEPESARPNLDAAPIGIELTGFEAAVARVVWAVGRASRFVPRVNCLVRAVSAQVMLAREGIASTVRFGVSLPRAGTGAKRFRAHAWLECAGRVVIGGEEDLSQFSPLPAFAWRQARGFAIGT